jgi:hypothetical protein
MAALWFGLAIVPIVGFVVETGNWLEHQRHLQLQADAAALAGGNLLGNCFSGAGSASILNEATKYSGVTQGRWQGQLFPNPAYGSTDIHNTQVGGSRKGTVTILYQSQTYQDGTREPLPPYPQTETQQPCDTPSLMLDVKATESNLPWFLDWAPLLPGFGGGDCGFFVCAINTHARVQLRALGETNPALPLAVPDINPRKVGVTFVNEAGAELTGCSGLNKVTGTPCTFEMTKGSPSGGLNTWSGGAGITLPAAPAKIGMRIGLGGVLGSCAGTVGVTGQYACYDNTTTNNGLYLIRDFDWGGPVGTQPILDGVSPTTNLPTSAQPCSGSQFYSDVSAAPSPTCPAGIEATVDFGTAATVPDTSKYQLTATIANADGKKSTTVSLAPVPGSYDATHHAWLWRAPNGAAILSTGVGTQSITLDWTVAKGTAPICPGTKDCTGTFSNVHRFYSAPTDGSGPVRSVSVTESGLEVAALTPGFHTLQVTLGVSGNFSIRTKCPPPPSGGSYDCSTDRPSLIRFSSLSGSRTYAVDCGTPAGHSGGDLYQQIHWGCANRFSVNSLGYCPNPSPPTPTDCVPIGNVGSGVKTGQVRAALNDRFVNDPPFNGTCAANNYPVVQTGDPRVLIVMVTDASAFDGSGGSGSVPIITYGAFYVTGWDGAPAGCDHEPFSKTGPGTSQIGDLWGHFVKYVSLVGSGGGSPCDPSGLLPCVPVLTQ